MSLKFSVFSFQLEVDSDEALGFVRGRFLRRGEPGDGLTGSVELGEGGLEGGDGLGECFALGAAAGIDSRQVGDPGMDEAVCTGGGDVDNAVEYGSLALFVHGVGAAVGE